MNIFGVGGAELVLIIVIMLIVAGPKRMIRWAYVIGQYVGKFRVLWEQMVDVLQDEVDAAGLDVKIPKEIPTRATIAKTASDIIKPYAETLESAADEVKNPLQETIDTTNKIVKDTKKETEAAAKVDMGSWDGKKSTSPSDTASKSVEKAEANKANFGAWSKPETPGQASEREV